MRGIFAISVSIAVLCQVVVIEASPAKADFCKSLLDHLVLDVELSVNSSENYSAYKSSECGEYKDVREQDGSMAGMMASYGIYHESDYRRFESFMENWCNSTALTSASREVKVDFVKRLNPSMARAIETCPAQSNRLPIVAEEVKASPSGALISITLKLNDDVTIIKAKYEGLKDCEVINFEVGKEIVLKAGKTFGYISCTRKKGEGNVIFQDAAVHLFTTAGSLFPASLPEVKKVKIKKTYSYKWEKGSPGSQSFMMADQCHNTRERVVSCNADIVGHRYLEHVGGSASLPAWPDPPQGINFTISSEGDILTLRGGGSCDNEHPITDVGIPYYCARKPKYVVQ